MSYDNWPTDNSEPNNDGGAEYYAEVESIGTWNDEKRTVAKRYVIAFEEPCNTAVQIAGPANNSVFPVGTTPVTYRAMDAAGNETVRTFNVTVLPNATVPTITALGPTTFCAGDSVVLMSSSAINNTWSTGATTDRITVTTSGTYTVTVNDGPGCVATSLPVTVTVNPLPPTPTIAANGPTTFCAGGSITLSSSSASGNVWNTGASAQDIVVNSAGTYAVTVSNANGCSATSAPVQVNIDTPFSIGTPNPIQICRGTSVSLSFLLINEAANGTWTDAGSTVVSGEVAPTSSTNYTYTIPATGTCPQHSITVGITVIQPPQAGTNGTVSICSTDPVINLIDQLGGTPATTGTWSGPSPVTAGIYDPASMSAGVYTYTVTGTPPCPAATSTVVVQEFTATTNTTNASSCDSYTWSVNGITYTQSGTYTSVSGCGTQILALTITPSTSNTTTITQCDSYTWPVNGVTYTQSGTYTSVDGCNTETLALTIVSSTSNTTTLTQCDSYTWNVNGVTYTQSGTYTSVDGCNTEILVLTITPSTSNTTTLTQCDSYTWSVNGPAEPTPQWSAVSLKYSTSPSRQAAPAPPVLLPAIATHGR